MAKLQRQKMVLNIFSLRNLEIFPLNFAIFSFLYDLITKKARKLEVAESNLIMENTPIARARSLSPFLSLSLGVFLFP